MSRENITCYNLRAYTSDDQVIGWTYFDQPEYIEQGSKRLEFTYGHHRQRIGQQYTASGSTTTKVYVGACEYITKNTQTTTHTYLSGPEGLFALHVKNPNGSEHIRYIHTDHLGSWNTITGENGNLLQELSFDAWGNRRNPATWRAFTGTPPGPLFDRGFTGHEHLYGFQLINMNGRMYDPVVSRMLSPDNFVQAPDFSQSFNRYSYCWNNPLVYTDPSGEMVMFYALGLYIAGSIIENSINYKDYGHRNFTDALVGGIKQGVNAYNEIQNVTSFPVYQNENFSFSMGLSMTGLGINANLNYRAGNFNIGLGGGFNSVVNPELTALTGSNSFELVPQLAGGIGYADDDFSFNYYQTYYGGMHKQRVGGVSFSTEKFSMRWENDFFALTGDKWRSNAMEFDIKGFVFGYSTYNNDPEGQRQRSFNGASPTWGVNKSKYDAWEDGRTYLSPFWIGIRNGNNITRLGYSHDLVQDLTQNFMHQQSIFKPGNQHYYLNYDYNYKGKWGYSGYYNPFSLY